jgi:SNF2 family DNA or RNA helicase
MYSREKFKAELRRYQQKGVNWLYFLHSLQFGACLADDMGLGKTVEVLAFLHILKSEKPGKKHPANLLVIPASLIFNWSYEIRRFSPDIRFSVAHPSAGADKKSSGGPPGSPEDFDLVITTYAMAQKYEWLRSYLWNYIILDEAQAIKNPGTKQARAFKELPARNRIIMTGTPIENRLSDLWSLFDFLNPGLLGAIKEFKVASPHASKSAQTGETQAEQILAILKRTKTGIDAAALKRKTGFDEKIIRNILYSAVKRDEIERVERGVYRKKRPGASPSNKGARQR